MMENDTQLVFRFDMADALAIVATLKLIGHHTPNDLKIKYLIVKFNRQIREKDEQIIKMGLLEFTFILAYLTVINTEFLESKYIGKVCQDMQIQLIMRSTEEGMREAMDEFALKQLLLEAGIK